LPGLTHVCIIKKMNMRAKIILMCVFSACLSGKSAELLAQGVSTGQNAYEDSAGGQQTAFDDLKKKMKASVKEHERLTEENRALKTRLIELQSEAERLERESPARRVPSKEPEIRITDRELSESSLLLGKDARTPGEEAQALYLSGQTMNIPEGQRLKELLVYDLQYQKQELELDLKLKEYWYGNLERENQTKMDVLAEEVFTMKEQERLLLEKAARQELMAADMPAQIEMLKMENQMLRKKIKQ